jgi:hypothetical protein
MRVRVLFLISAIKVVLSYSINIFYSSPSHAPLDPQPAAGTPVVPCSSLLSCTVEQQLI